MDNAILSNFKSLFSEGKKPNFIFVGGSLFELASLASFVGEMRAKGVSMRGLICDYCAPPHRRQIRDSHIYFLDKDSYRRLEAEEDFSFVFSFWGNAREAIKHFIRLLIGKPVFKEMYSEEDPLYLFYPSAYDPPDYLWNTVLSISNHIELIQFDEGLGTYVLLDSIDEQNKDFMKSKKCRNMLQAMYSKSVSTVKAIIKRMQRGLISEQEYLLFSVEDDGCVVNSDHAPLYEDAFYHYGLTQNAITRNYDNAVIIVGFDFAKLDDTISYEMTMYRKIKKEIDKYGVEIIFRPHPAQKQEHIEQYRSLGVEMWEESEVPLESALAISEGKPKAIIGLGSTSQATASAFWGIPCISVSKLLQHELKKGGEIASALDLAFRKHKRVSALFARYMTTPESYDDFSCRLKEALS